MEATILGRHSKALFALAAMFFVTIALANPAWAAPPSFEPAVPRDVAVGDGPFDVTSGDFDGDGNRDLAVSSSADDNVSILPGNGDGTFGARTTYAVGDAPTGIVSGDFDGDDDLDLATGNFFDGSVSVLLGDGDGTFTAATPRDYTTGSLTNDIFAADINGDGNLDLATPNRDSNNVSVLLGNGDGTFDAAVNYAVGSSPADITVADFDGDDNPDIATANQGSNNVSVLLGNGDGTFDAAVNFSTVGTVPFGVASGDFDGDGDQDIATANRGSNNASVMLGNGDGTFAAAIIYAAGNDPTRIIARDLNGDGDPDLAVTNQSSDNVSVLEGNGDGTFLAAVNFDVGGGPADLTSADFNDDERPDLATANIGANVSILLNNTVFPPDCSDGQDNDSDGDTDFPDDGGCESATDDNETGTPALSINGVTVTEGNAGTVNATFTITRTGDTGGSSSVTYATADGTATAPGDYTSALGISTFDPGDTSKQITVQVNGDTTDEPDENFFVNLTNPTGATVSNGQGVGTITDDDAAPTLSITDKIVTEGDTGTTSATFTVSLSAASARTVTVNYATADDTASAGSDYAASTGALTFDPGETEQEIAVSVNGDRVDEDDETFSVNLSSATNATISDGQGIGTITDDDTAGISVEPTSGLVTSESGGTDTFTVVLDSSPTSDVTIPLSSSDATEGTVSPESLTFTPQNFSTPQTATVTGADDEADDGDIGYQIVTGAATGSDPNYSGRNAADVSVTNTDDDGAPAISIEDESVTEGDTGTNEAVFTVTLDRESSQTVTVDYATDDGTASAPGDYASKSDTVTFASGQTSRQITVSVNGDTADEPDETFEVNLTNPTNATIFDGRGIGTIRDDDRTPPPPPACSDGKDNDGDGRIDSRDPGCSGPNDDSEADPPAPSDRCTITGTSGNDRLVGTPGRDVICSLGGNDAVNGLGGDDIIRSGSGNDSVLGGAGDDEIRGGSGDDVLRGEGGDDALFGEGGNDRLVGGLGKDRLSGGPGRDSEVQ